MANVMDKVTEWCERVLMPIGIKFSNQRHLAAIRDGMTILIPITVIGGFACLLAVPPVPTDLEGTNFFFNFLLAWKSWSTANSSILYIPYQLSIGCLSIYVVAGVAYNLAKSYGYNGISNAAVSLFIFLCVSDAVDVSAGTINYSYLGAGYMFGGLVVAIATVEIVHLFNHFNLVIKLPDAVPPNVAAPFNVLLPSVASVIGFMLLNVLCTSISGAGITSLVFSIFRPLISGANTLPSCLVVAFIVAVFWFFGIHGDNMVSPITSSITTVALAANLEAYTAGTEIPYIWAGYMLNVFGVWLVMNAVQAIEILFCKSGRLKGLVKVSIVPSLFNINEPSTFGVPFVLNPTLFIGKVGATFVNIIVYWLCASAGLVGKWVMTLPFSTPGIILAVLGTLDWRSGVLWVILFFVDMAIMYPFMMSYDQQLLKEEEEYAASQSEA